ncbi:MAG: T9SS type A sorting domain-containing protein, partial [Polaribacter sp.]
GVTVNANTQYWINIGHFDGTTDNPEGSFTIDISTTDTTVLKVESNSIENFTLFPTVVKDNLSFTSQEKVDVLTIYNITGQEVLSRKPQLTNGNINVSSLSNGMYIVKVKAGNSLGSYKIIKK